MLKNRIVHNFTLTEMQIPTKELDPYIVEFAQMIQKLRCYYGKPMKVNSWYRTVKQNKKVGGSPNSIHLDGRAVDIAVTDYANLINAWREICKAYGKIGGVNMYNTFMHFDNYEDKFGYDDFVIRDYRSGKR